MYEYNELCVKLGLKPLKASSKKFVADGVKKGKYEQFPNPEVPQTSTGCDHGYGLRQTKLEGRVRRSKMVLSNRLSLVSPVTVVFAPSPSALHIFGL